MADRKISALSELTDPLEADVFHIIDASVSDADKNKKIKYDTIFKKLIAGTAAAPSLAWRLDGNTGFYRSAEDQIGLTHNGSFTGRFTSSGLQLGGTTGTSTTASLHVIDTGVDDTVIIESTDAGTSGAPDFVLWRNSASPDVDDTLGSVEFRGESSTGVARSYAKIQAQIESETNTAEHGKLHLMAASAGTTAARLTVFKEFIGVGITEPTDLLHVHNDITGYALRLACDANDTATGANICFDRSKAANPGAANDGLSKINFRGRNNHGTPQAATYAAISTYIKDPTDGGEDGGIIIGISRAGTVRDTIKIETDGTSTDIILEDQANIVPNATTGTKIGTATSQKIGLWNATPIVQPSAIANITTAASSGTLPTPNGSITIANAATPTVVELLEYCTELESKLESALAALRSVGIIAT